MNEYTFFQAAEKAKVGEKLQSVHWDDDFIVKEEDCFYWESSGRAVQLVDKVLSVKWIIVEEAERERMEKKLKDFVADLSEEERGKLRELMDRGTAFNVGIKE